MSEKINDGGAAFPGWESQIRPGMTLRDWFAGQALATINSGGSPEWKAVIAYMQADAMLAQRAKGAGE